MQLGTLSGANFVPSTPGDGLSFVATLNNREETGAFPKVFVGEDRIVFIGSLAAGGTAHFVVFVHTDNNTVHTITLRQIAIPSPATAPALKPWALALLVVLLSGLAAFRLRRPKPARSAL